MSVAEQNIFPVYIDRPRLIGVFEMDEFFLAFILMTVILAASLAFPNLGSLPVMITAIATGVGSAVAYGKFKRSRPDGYTLQKLYRSGLFSPADDKKALITHPYLRKIGRPVIPYGFTDVLYT